MRHLHSTLIQGLIVSLIFLHSCTPASQESSDRQLSTNPNPAAEGFNKEASDSTAIAIADKVMEAMGGREAWDKTRYISWTFFGRRDLVWDKYTGDVQITIPDKDLRIVTNVNKGGGKAWGNELEFIETDTLNYLLDMGKSIWINDSYWLVMPYKLKDSGVTLHYAGERQSTEGKPSYVLDLTFDGVGDTPQNRYEVLVDTNTYLVTEWAFYATAQDTTAAFSTPWSDYKQYGRILLSGNRGKNKLDNIFVQDSLEHDPFTVVDP